MTDNVKGMPKLSEAQRRALLRAHENPENALPIASRDMPARTAQKLAEAGLVEIASQAGTQERRYATGVGRSRAATEYVTTSRAKVTDAGRELAHSLGGTPKAKCAQPDCSDIIPADTPQGLCRYHGPSGRGWTGTACK